MKSILTFLILVLAGSSLFSQNDDRIARTKTPLSEVERLVMPAQDNAALLAAEMDRRGPGIAPRFAVNLETNVSPDHQGRWDYLANGNAVWRLRILSADAKSINLGFSKYHMPEGGTLVLYAPDYSQVMGPFTPSDNEEHEQLWTPVFPGDELVVEVQVPLRRKPELELELKYVNHDFLGFAEMLSGSCNLDVNCGAADGWDIVDQYRDIIQSVAVIGTGGGTFCTGFLVNSTRQDCTPFFMTAFHCTINAGNAASLVAYWNFENSTCRQPNSPASGGSGNGMLNDFNTGSIWRSGWSNSDFTLVELDDPVSETANAFFAGWTAEPVAPADTVICVHHPSTDEKRISFEFDPTHAGNWPGANPAPNGNHIIVPDWDIGTTEGGSSGAPLFDNQKRVVGQLHGGGAACGNNDYDSYGWFHFSWEGGGSPTTRLKDWLDPDNSGILSLDGRSQLQCSFFVDATPSNLELCAPDEAVVTITVSENFTSDVMLSVEDLPGGLVATFDSDMVAPGGTTMLTIGNTSGVTAGVYNFTVEGTDGTESNFSEITLSISTEVPSIPMLLFPGDSTTGIGLTPIYTWETEAAASYTIEIAADPDFTTIIETVSGIETGTYQAGIALESLITYYWRVKGENVCGEGDWSEEYEFVTGSILCSPFVSTDVPIVIPSNGTPVVTSTLEMTTGGFIDDVNVNNVDINHTWVGDLRIELTSPSGTTVQLMTNPLGGDCDGSDVAVSFDDDSPNPYSALAAMCNPSPPAISGVFQPFNALTAFNGEPAIGTWTLTVYDDANLDGGSLEGWSLEVCSTVPNDFSLNPSTDFVESCPDEAVTFTIVPGTAFSDTGITFSADNLPAGAMATFTPDTGIPGEEVTVVLSGAMESGDFMVDINADDGVNAGSTQIQWTVNDAPSAPTAVTPLNGETGVTLNPVITWTLMPDAEYNFVLATDSAFDNVLLEGVVDVNFINVTALDPCTTYYWLVTAEDGCGISDTAAVYSFSTELDLTFEANPPILTACSTDEVTTVITLGNCFDGDVLLSADALPGNINIGFSNNMVPSGGSATVTLNLMNATPGDYSIVITGDDGMNTVAETINLNVTGPAPSPVNLEPADQAVNVSLLPVFAWEAVSGAINYQFELATDDNFTNVVNSEMTTSTSLALSMELEEETTYFWRVTAFNDCGGTTPAPFSFTTEIVDAVTELNGLTVVISPNPVGQFLNVNFSESVAETVEVSIFAANGIRLSEKRLNAGDRSLVIDVSAFPSGVYLVKLASANTSVTERIIKE